MNSELSKKIKDYREQLEKELEEAKAERLELITRFEKGLNISKKENKRNAELAALILDLEEKLAKFAELDIYENIEKGLNKLASGKHTRAEKDEIIKILVENFKLLYKENFEKLKSLCEEYGVETSDLGETKAKLEENKAALSFALATLKSHGHDTSSIENEINEIENLIEMINDYLEKYDETAIREDLHKLSLTKTKTEEKQAILSKYQSIIKEHKSPILDSIIEDMLILGIDIEEDELTDGLTDDEDLTEDKPEDGLTDDDIELEEDEQDKKKKETKEKSNKLSEILKKHKKAIIAIATAAAMTVTILIVAKGCSKQQTSNNDLNNQQIGTLEENKTREKIQALIDKGYSEYHAIEMVKNFSEDTIDTLINSPYIEAVENYYYVKDFNLDYLTDYENARNTYVITADNAVDYVNRSYQIQATGFYDNASINDIVEVVMAIDNKTLFTANNANIAQSFNTSFNGIVNNYLFSTVTEEDTKKLDALQYFAKEGSDMDQFLTEFATLTKTVVTNPENKEAKDKMYSFINIFATSLNGFNNEPSVLTSDEEYNKSSQINDYYNWYMAYNSFIAPLYPTFITEENFEQYEELQYLMITALEGPEFEELCGKSRTLGGEQ